MNKQQKLTRAKLNEVKEVFLLTENLPTSYSEILTHLVDFFQKVSKIQDEGLGEIPKKIFRKNVKTQKLLNTLNLHISRAGRDLYGMNRTKIGEQVTKNNVYIGSVYGYNTLTVSEWEKQMVPPEIAYHAQQFIVSHRPALELCKEIEKVVH